MIPPELLARFRGEGFLELRVKVVPKSSREEIAGVLEDGSLKVRISAAPEKGRANAALCELLAAEFQVPRRAVRITGGETSARKTVRIEA